MAEGVVKLNHPFVGWSLLTWSSSVREHGTKIHPLGGWVLILSRALANSDRIVDVQAIKAIKGGSALL